MCQSPTYFDYVVPIGGNSQKEIIINLDIISTKIKSNQNLFNYLIKKSKMLRLVIDFSKWKIQRGYRCTLDWFFMMLVVWLIDVLMSLFIRMRRSSMPHTINYFKYFFLEIPIGFYILLLLNTFLIVQLNKNCIVYVNYWHIFEKIIKKLLIE